MNKIFCVIFLFISMLCAAEIPGRPDIRPLQNKDIVSIVRGFTNTHKGIDFACFGDSKVNATGDGEIITARWIPGYGNTIIIKHEWVRDGKPITVYSLYGHLAEFLYLKGAKVKKGQVIALSGTSGRSEGYHLHYELRNANQISIWNGKYQTERRLEESVNK